MRKLVLASVIALASAAAMVSPADAHVYMGVGSYFGFGPFGDFYDDSPVPVYGPYFGAPRYDYGGPYYDEYDSSVVIGYPQTYYSHHHRHCRLEHVTHWRHHHRVVERVRVCR